MISNVNTQLFHATVSNFSAVTACGKAKTQQLCISSSSAYDASKFETDEAKIEASDSSIAKLWVTKKLHQSKYNSSIIRWHGNPELY
jgi:hypothetical protein